MNPQDAQTLVDYHYWARDRVLDAIDTLSVEQYTRALGSSFTSVRETIVHTYSAEWNWYSRWTGASPVSMLDPKTFPDRWSVRRAWTDQEVKVRGYVGTMTQQDLDRTLEYKLMNGEPAQSVFCHMLQHVVNHATYHRGQITAMIRQLGAPAPESQDLIRFYRERDQAT